MTAAVGEALDAAVVEALSQEFALVCRADGSVRWCDGRATRRFGLREGASLFDVVRRGTEAKLGALLAAGCRREVPDWEVLLAVEGRALTVSFRAKPFDEGVALVGCVVPEGYARALEQVSGALSEIASLHRETERQQRELMEAHEALEDAARRDAFLAAVGAELAGRPDIRAALRGVLAVTVPQFADWAVVDVREGAGVARLASVHADPSRDARCATVVWPETFSGEDGLGRTARRGVSEQLQGAALASFAVDPATHAWLDALGTVAMLVTPLVVRGAVIGALVLGVERIDRRFDTLALPLAEDLARRVAVAFDNARMGAAEVAENAARDGLLLEAARSLVGPTAVLLGAAARLRATTRDAVRAEAIETVERAARDQSHAVEGFIEAIEGMRRRSSAPAEATAADGAALLGAVGKAR